MTSASLTYAVGDIHGCATLLDRLLAAIEVHAAGRARRLVFLGDYVDRGPDSAGVVERLMALEDREPEAVVCLSGNHEDMMARAAEGHRSLKLWLQNGGHETLDSYQALRLGDVPEIVLTWMAGLSTLYEDERRIFVHAGLQPGRPVEPEDRETRLWIREPFLFADHDFGKHVVHGHTPLERGFPDFRRHRTNLDTAAVFGGALTAGIFTDERDGPVGLLQARAEGAVQEIRL